MRIYRHALEAIFAMLTLGDLSRVLAVSREWAAAVRSMGPILAQIDRDDCRDQEKKIVFRPLPPIASIVGSPLLRHLAIIQISDSDCSSTPLNNASLALLAQHAPHLTSLWCNLTLTPNQPLILPAKLAMLDLELGDTFTAASINFVLTSVCVLESLSYLGLSLASLTNKTTAGVELSLLAACPSLVDLKLEGYFAGSLQLSDTQMEQIRWSLGHLHRLSISDWTSSAKLARLLKLPVTARWRDIGTVEFDARTKELILRLPTLTTLELAYGLHCPDVNFLPQLPSLTALDMCSSGGEPGGWFLPTDALLATLLLCPGLTKLALTCAFKSSH